MLVLLFMLLSFAGAAEVAASNGQSSGAETEAYRACMADCEKFYEQYPANRPKEEEKNFVCRESDLQIISRELISFTSGTAGNPACAAGVLQGATDILNFYITLVPNIGEFLRKNAQERKEFLQSCDRDRACRLRLARELPQYRERDPKTGRFLRGDDEVWKEIGDLDMLELLSRVDVAKPQVQEHCSRLLESGIEEKLRTVGEPMSAEEMYAWMSKRDLSCVGTLGLAQNLKRDPKPTVDLFASLGIKLACYGPSKTRELACYGLTHIILDPLSLVPAGFAAKLATKAGVAIKAVSVGTNVKRLVTAESLLARKLTLAQTRAIERAHRVGKGPIGNYSPSEIREKARILHAAGFNRAEVRKLMEEGVVGMPPSVGKGFMLGDRHLDELVQMEKEAGEHYFKVDAEIRAATALSEAERESLALSWKNAHTRAEQDIYAVVTKQYADEAAAMAEIKRIRNEYLKREEELRAAMKPQTVKPATSWDVKSLQANKAYPFPNPEVTTIKEVVFEPRVVSFLQKQQVHESDLFIKALGHGIVGDRGYSGIKRLPPFSRLVEVKVMGAGRNQRILGCLDHGILRLITVVQKTGNIMVPENMRHACD